MTDTREDGRVTVVTQVGVVQRQAKERQGFRQPPEAWTEAQSGFSLTALGRNPANA